MSQQEPQGPSAAVRWLVSLAVLAHLFAILTAVTSFSSSTFPAPELAVRMNRPVAPYLQATFLNNSYRFFSPNPGAPSVLWFRVQYGDGRIRWVEAPRPSGCWARIPYQRRLNLAMQIAGHLAPPGPDGKRQMTDSGRVWVASYVRHVVRDHARTGRDGQAIPIRSVGVYSVQHAPRLPEQAALGWDAEDLRTYLATFVGAYTPEGERVDEFRPDAVDRPISYVAAGILKVDVYPLLRKHDRAEHAGLLGELHLPGPIRRLLAQFPELQEPLASADSLQERIEMLVTSATRQPGGA